MKLDQVHEIIGDSQEILECQPAALPDDDPVNNLFKPRPPEPIDGFEAIMKEEQIDTRSGAAAPSDDFFN